jgi:6-hydroxytryprostatin B O-methyltransferase
MAFPSSSSSSLEELALGDCRSQLPSVSKLESKWMHSSPTWDVNHLVIGWDWAGLGAAKVVDVGGSSRHASVPLAGSFPELRFVAQDLPYVISKAVEVDKISGDLKERIQLIPYDFFWEQSLKDAGGYLLRQILHDWPYASAAQILKNLLPVL